MENLSAWFQEQLAHSAETFAWAVEQVPERRRWLAPPHRPQEWPMARHVFHMMYYERKLALPSMRQWLGEEVHLSKGMLQEDNEWNAGIDLAATLEEFRAVRTEEITLLKQFGAEDFERTLDTWAWNEVTLRWVVTKTLQHTFEHTRDILAIALFWPSWVKRAREKQA
jgi:hypothetical protein